MQADPFSRIEIPDLWQMEGIRALQEGFDVVVDAPTGAGKTRIFEGWFETAAHRKGQVVFTVPTRALANEKFLEWKSKGWSPGIVTGDRNLDSANRLIVATLETQRERLLRGDPPALLALDEYQLIAHSTRGIHYEIAVAIAPADTQLLFLSGSVANPDAVLQWLEKIGRRGRLVRSEVRPVPLEELPVENLPNPPGSPREFWPRLAASVLRAGLCPLLIFAPRRKEAERIARAVASGLPPLDSIRIERQTHELLGKELSSLLQRGVGCHHSGLSFATRAGVVEPLAKFGQLPFVVATTGLAAGINFSVRSVLVTDARYFEGERERELSSAELLQMFGRAGRRGLDEIGTVLWLPNGPSLGNAAPEVLRRREEIEWPAMLRIMELSEFPFRRSREIADRLFCKTPPLLGLPGESARTVRGGGNAPGPVQRQLLAADGSWHPAARFSSDTLPRKRCRIHWKNQCISATSCPDESLLPGPGRLCKWKDPDDQSTVYGRELTTATRGKDDIWCPTKPVKKLLNLGAREEFPFAELSSVLLPLLEEHFRPALLKDAFRRGDQFVSRWDSSSTPVSALVDPDGVPLLRVPERVVERSLEVLCREGNEKWTPASGLPIRAWRELGLIAENGFPTMRGKIFSRFQGGEGLMMAAALEAEDYPVEELVIHLANLRGGYRFRDFPEGPSERLAFTARAAFGHKTFGGYLRDGLNPQYGENTAEALHLAAREGFGKLRKLFPDARKGDIERARIEWLSLLNHICSVQPPEGCAAWKDLQRAAEAIRGTIPAPPELPLAATPKTPRLT